MDLTVNNDNDLLEYLSCEDFLVNDNYTKHLHINGHVSKSLLKKLTGMDVELIYHFDCDLSELEIDSISFSFVKRSGFPIGSKIAYKNISENDFRFLEDYPTISRLILVNCTLKKRLILPTTIRRLDIYSPEGDILDNLCDVEELCVYYCRKERLANLPKIKKLKIYGWGICYDFLPEGIEQLAILNTEGDMLNLPASIKTLKVNELSGRIPVTVERLICNVIKTGLSGGLKEVVFTQEIDDLLEWQRKYPEIAFSVKEE